MSEDRSSSDQGQSSWLGRLASAFSDEPKNRDELLEVLQNAARAKIVDEEALRIIDGAMEVSDMQVREIMIPRSQMVFIDSTLPPREFLPKIIEAGHSRFPVIGENPDIVIGVLLAKDLLPVALNEGLDNLDILQHVRTPTFVPESKRLNVLLKDFRATRNHMAIVVDEYGCIAGLVTIEDVLEQIVGDIEDEHDTDELDSNIRQFKENDYIVKALTPIDDFNEFFKAEFDEDEFDTIGGFITQCFGRLPQREEEAELQGFHFKILNADNRRIRLLQVTPLVTSSDT